MKGKEFRRRVKELAAELDMDTAYLNRELGVGFSGGEKKKVEMLQLLLLQPNSPSSTRPTPASTSTPSAWCPAAWTRTAAPPTASLVIITHNTRILEHLEVDRVHVMVNGRIVREDDASLIRGSTPTASTPLSAKQPSSSPRASPARSRSHG